jgi:hypothetical protein
MRQRISGTPKLVIALTLSAVQLLSVAWIPVVHAQMAVPSHATALHDITFKERIPVHDQSLCRICSASHFYSPHAYGVPGLDTTNREYKYPGLTHTEPRQHHPSSGNAIRAPPSR